MSEQGYLNGAWLVVAIGTAMTVYLALAPMINVGYRLRVDVLLAGLLPYFIYILGAWLNRGPLLLLLGGLLIGGLAWVHGTVDIDPHPGEQDQIVFTWSFLSTALVLLAFWAATRAGPVPDEDTHTSK